MARDARRAAIKEAAATLVWEKGLGAATVRAVAAAIGASPGQIHHHFDTADDLRAEAFREAWRRMAADHIATQQGKPPLERLYGLLDGADGDCVAGAMRLWKDALAAAKMSENVRLAVNDALAHWQSVIVDVLREGKACGAFPPGLDELPVAGRLMALSLGLDVWADIGFHDASGGDRGTIVAMMIETELRSAAAC